MNEWYKENMFSALEEFIEDCEIDLREYGDTLDDMSSCLTDKVREYFPNDVLYDPAPEIEHILAVTEEIKDAICEYGLSDNLLTEHLFDWQFYDELYRDYSLPYAAYYYLEEKGATDND